MDENERQTVEKAAALELQLSTVTARLVLTTIALRLTLEQLLPDFASAFESHFVSVAGCDEEPEAGKVRQQILEKSAELYRLHRDMTGESK